MEQALSSETSVFILRTPGKFPKAHRLHSEHGESLKTTILYAFLSSTMPYWLIAIISIIIRPLQMTKHLCVWSTPLYSDVQCFRFKCSHKRCFLKARSRRSSFTVKVQVLDPYKAACKCALRLFMRNYEPYLTSHFCSGIFLFMHPKLWAIRLTSAPVNEAKDTDRLLYDIWEAHLWRSVAPWLDRKSFVCDYYNAGSWELCYDAADPMIPCGKVRETRPRWVAFLELNVSPHIVFCWTINDSYKNLWFNCII